MPATSRQHPRQPPPAVAVPEGVPPPATAPALAPARAAALGPAPAPAAAPNKEPQPADPTAGAISTPELGSTVSSEGSTKGSEEQPELVEETSREQIMTIWRQHGRPEKIAELERLVALAGSAEALLVKVQQKYSQRAAATQAEKDAAALGRADKPLPVGTRVAVAGRGRGTYVGSYPRWFGANDHTIAFDGGSTVTLQLRSELWTVFASEMDTMLETQPEPEPEPEPEPLPPWQMHQHEEEGQYANRRRVAEHTATLVVGVPVIWTKSTERFPDGGVGEITAVRPEGWQCGDPKCHRNHGGDRLVSWQDGACHFAPEELVLVTPESVAERAERRAERRAALRAQFGKGAHARTVDGMVGEVKKDAAAEGSRANEVQLRLADGSQSDFIKVDELVECTEAEVAEFEAGLMRWAALRAQFKKGTHAKTVEGVVGVVQEDAPGPEQYHANKVKLQLAGCSRTTWIKVDTLVECSEAEVVAYETEVARIMALRAQFEEGVLVKTGYGAFGVVTNSYTVLGDLEHVDNIECSVSIRLQEASILNLNRLGRARSMHMTLTADALDFTPSSAADTVMASGRIDTARRYHENGQSGWSFPLWTIMKIMLDDYSMQFRPMQETRSDATIVIVVENTPYHLEFDTTELRDSLVVELQQRCDVARTVAKTNAWLNDGVRHGKQRDGYSYVQDDAPRNEAGVRMLGMPGTIFVKVDKLTQVSATDYEAEQARMMQRTLVSLSDLAAAGVKYATFQNKLVDAEQRQQQQALIDGNATLCVNCKCAVAVEAAPWGHRYAEQLCCKRCCRSVATDKPRENLVGKLMVQGYCMSRFGRILPDAQAHATIELLCEQDPPVLNRNDPRIADVFSIVDGMPDWATESWRDCPTFAVAQRFIETLEFKSGTLDPLHHCCYCIRGATDGCGCRRPDLVERGSGTYGLPKGWCGFGLRVDAAEFERRKVFETWNVAFHGTTVKTAREILKSDWQLLNPGETTPSGYTLPIRDGHIKEGAVAGFDPNQIFTSPSIKYCSYRSFYCDAVDFEDHSISVAFQLRQEPGTYTVGPETVGALMRRQTIDPLFKNEELEWFTKAHGVHKLYRLLVRVGPKQTAEEKARMARIDPRWVADAEKDECMINGCSTTFSLLERKHHCYYCGWVVCGTCSSQTMALDRWVERETSVVITAKRGEEQEKRVCHNCFATAPAEIKARRGRGELEAAPPVAIAVAQHHPPELDSDQEPEPEPVA